jgi:hypothetical protein
MQGVFRFARSQWGRQVELGNAEQIVLAHRDVFAEELCKA